MLVFFFLFIVLCISIDGVLAVAPQIERWGRTPYPIGFGFFFNKSPYPV